MTGLAAGVSAGQETVWDAEHDVELVLAFLNTLDVEDGTDVLDDELDWRAWVTAHRLRTGSATAQARALRDALRASVGDRGSPPVPGAGGDVRVQLAGGLPTLVATDTLGDVLASAVRLTVLGHWERMKICPADDCRWAFFDRSRNRSRTWCSMQVCGNREKARNWRERARSATV